MTQDSFPITPPPELFAEWFADSLKTLDRKVSEDDRGTTGLIAGAVAIQAARWGADEELEACCEWLFHDWIALGTVNKLRAARRPKPPSLKELNLKHLEVMERDGHYLPEIIADLRRAIESLPS